MILQIKPVELPTDFNGWFHPDLNAIDPLAENKDEREYTEEEWRTLQDNGGIAIRVVTTDIESISELLGVDVDCDSWGGMRMATYSTHICAFPHRCV